MNNRRPLVLGPIDDTSPRHSSNVPHFCRGPFIDGATQDRTAIAYHVTMRLIDGRGLARGVHDLRRATRILYEQGDARGLLAFRLADTHAHVLLAAGRAAAGELARYAQSAIHQALALPVAFERARIRAVAEPRHLANAIRYVFRQEEHHGTRLDPTHDGSSLPDLLGMRSIGASATVQRVRQWLPRLTRAELVAWLGAGPFESTPPDLVFAADAAAATLALPSIAGRTPDHMRARLAAVHLFGREATVRQISAALGETRRSVQRLRATSPDPALLRAAQLQLRLRTAIHARVLDAFV